MSQTLDHTAPLPMSAWAQTVMAHPQRWVIVDTETTGTDDQYVTHQDELA